MDKTVRGFINEIKIIMNYEVTIGIPLYNVEPFINRTMESILSQTFDSIEFLIIDDCGKDNSVNIVQEIQQQHPRGCDIRMLHQSVNMGVSAARNRIIDEAKGRYLYFMDSDDLITPNTISLLHESLIKNKAEIAYGSYEKIEVYNKNNVSDRFCYPDIVLDNGELGAFAFRKYGGIQASACNYLVDLFFLRKTGLRFIDANYWEDMVFTYQLVTFVNRAVLHSEITYYYMCRENSLSKYQSREQVPQTEILRNVETIEHLKQQTKNVMNKKYLGNWCYNIVMTDFYIICNVLKNKNKIYPKLTSEKLLSFLEHPLNFKQIIKLSCSRNKNLFIYILSKLPKFLSISLIKLAGRHKGLV